MGSTLHQLYFNIGLKFSQHCNIGLKVSDHCIGIHGKKYCTAALQIKKTKKIRNNNLIVPKLQQSHIETINHVTGVHVGLTGLSWASLHLDKTRNYVMNWDHFAFPSNVQKMHINDLTNMIFDIKNNLPASDIYVTESLNVMRTNVNPNPIQQGVLTQLQSMLCVALNCTEASIDIENRRPKFIFLKNRITGRLFNLLIKSECLTCRNIIENIIDTQTWTDEEYVENKRVKTDKDVNTEYKTDINEHKDFDNEHKTAINEHKTAINEHKNVSNSGKESSHPWRDDLNFHTRVILDEHCICSYDASKGYTQESMSIALLYAICFGDLIVHPNERAIYRLNVPPSL